jgi:hypothetical protein
MRVRGPGKDQDLDEMVTCNLCRGSGKGQYQDRINGWRFEECDLCQGVGRIPRRLSLTIERTPIMETLGAWLRLALYACDSALERLWRSSRRDG